MNTLHICLPIEKTGSILINNCKKYKANTQKKIHKESKRNLIATKHKTEFLSKERQQEETEEAAKSKQINSK